MSNTKTVFEKEIFYNHKDIVEYAENNDYTLTEYGSSFIGEHFIVLKGFNDSIAISFVLVSDFDEIMTYECIYTDL